MKRERWRREERTREGRTQGRDKMGLRVVPQGKM